MKLSFTLSMLTLLTLSGATTASATVMPTMPVYLAETPRFQKTTQFKSDPAQSIQAENEQTCAVFINLPEDMQSWSPDICVACAPGQPVINPNGDYLYLQPGTYDIVARFTHTNPMSFTFFDYNGYVVLENVEVTGDMTINLDPSTITNHIVFSPILPDGSQLELPVTNIDESGNEVPVSDGSMTFSGLTVLDYVSGPGWGIDSSMGMSALINAETPWGFYDPTLMFGIHINDVSDRIHLGMGLWIGTPEYDDAYTLFMIGEQAGSEPGVVSNDAEGYNFYNFNPAWTPDGAATNDLIEQFPNDLGWVKPYGYAIRRVAGEFNRLSSGSILTQSDNLRIYSMAFSRNEIADPQIHVLVSPTKTELVKNGTDVAMTTNYGAWLEPFGEAKWIVYPQVDMAMTPASPEAFYPFEGVTVFNTIASSNKDEMFLTAPCLSVTLDRGFSPFEGTEYLELDITSMGRIGEARYTDLSVMDAELKVNGVKVANNLTAAKDWIKGFEADMAGVTELKLTDSNFEVEETRATTTSLSHFDMTNEDFFPPSVTMLQIRTADGILSSVIQQNVANTIRVGAGDFAAGTEAVNAYGQTATITTAPAAVNLWYAGEGSNEWTLLDCSAINSEIIDGIGNIYEAVVSDIECGWKDLKIRVEDESGNWMEQVIGRAFKMDSGTGITNLSADSAVKVSGNNILAPADAQIWSMDGTKTNGRNVTAGIYLVRSEDKTYKVIVK